MPWGHAHRDFSRRAQRGHQSLDVAGQQGQVEVVHVHHHADGSVDLDALTDALQASNAKTLVSLMHANNEVGVMVDLGKISALCRTHGAYFHSDTVQSMGHYPMDLSELDVDLTCSAHKFHGPKGTGFLYVHPTIRIEGLIVGRGRSACFAAALKMLRELWG